MLRQLCNVFVNHVETSTPVVGNIRGSIPSWLRGNFLFTSSGLIDLPSPDPTPSSPGSVPEPEPETHFTVNHYGDGYALLGNFHIKSPNHVTFQTKFLESSAYTKALAAGRTVLPEYGTPSTPEVGEKKKSKGGIFALLSGKTPETSDNGNHAMYRSGSNFYTTNGQAYFTQFNPADLQTGTKFETKSMLGLSSMGAHPLTDQDGALWNVGAKVGAGGATTNFIKIKTLPETETGEKAEFEILGAIPSVSSGNVSSIHTFGMTSNYLVFVDSPTTLNLRKYLQTTVTGADYALLDLVEWLPEHRNRFHIVDKSSGVLISAQKIIQSTDPFFYTHLTNCYEDHSSDDGNPQLVIDIHTFPNMAATLGLTVENLRNDAPICTPEEEGALQRFRVPLSTLNSPDSSTDPVDLTPQILTGQGISSVTLNRNYIGKPYRYCYGHGSYTRGPYANSVVKFDLESGSELKWNGGEHAYLTEVTFVENPNGGGGEGGAKEDDGVLIGGVCDLRKNEPDYLIILKAEDMTEIARVEFDNPIPVYVHGLFVPESSA